MNSGSLLDLDVLLVYATGNLLALFNDILLKQKAKLVEVVRF